MKIIQSRVSNALLLVTVVLFLSACGGSSSAAGSTHNVNISWAANKESAVNSAGGGYTVSITGQTPINVPYVSGATAPTSTSISLSSGSYSGTVTAYSALNPPGGSSGSKSAASAFTFTVP